MNLKLLQNPVVLFDVQPRNGSHVGSIMVGSVDRSRYNESQLQSLPILSQSDSIWNFAVTSFQAGKETILTPKNMHMHFGRSDTNCISYALLLHADILQKTLEVCRFL